MVSRDQLRIQALRAYEWGRLRTAARVAFVLVPVALLCLFENRGRAECVCVAAALLALCVWLRWRNRRGLEIVTTGLQAGSAPFLAGLVFDRLGIECGLGAASTGCTAFAALAGIAGGAFIGAQERQWQGRLWSFVTAAAIAALAASLGCIRLGGVGLVSVVAGIALGSIVMAGASRAALSR